MAWRGKVQHGMRIDIDVPIEADDGEVLRGDVYRPLDDDAHPVILSYGPYAKLLHYADGSPFQWGRMSEEHPETVQGTSNTYQAWEVVDPEKWVPDGYAVVRVDSRGAGRSPGFLDLLSPRETKDLYDCIEWCAAQAWCDGKVGLNGISYYAINQWQVAELQPPHLTAMCLWEGASDIYREFFWHGGIFCTFGDVWYEGRVRSGQHGVGARGARSRLTGDWIAGPETLPLEVLETLRANFAHDALQHPLFDEYWRARVPDLSKITVPLLSTGNWGGQGLHLRGNVEGFVRAGSEQKWLEVHGRQHWTHFYTDYGVDLQKRFFGHFLLGQDTGWTEQPRVLLQIRHPGERFEPRAEQEWPLARTAWTRHYLHPDLTLSTQPPTATATRSYDGLGDGLTFLSPPLEEPVELTGPSAAKLHLSSSTEDADVFLVLRVLTPDLREVTFHGANEPHTPIAHGWLRASHRELDEAMSEPYRPFHRHDERQPLTPHDVVELDVEIWPTCIVIPAGYRIALSVRGTDYVWPGAEPNKNLPEFGKGATAGAAFTGVGPFRHSKGADRPPSTFGGDVTLHWDTERQPYVLLPVIPAA